MGGWYGGVKGCILSPLPPVTRQCSEGSADRRFWVPAAWGGGVALRQPSWLVPVAVIEATGRPRRSWQPTDLAHLLVPGSASQVLINRPRS